MRDERSAVCVAATITMRSLVLVAALARVDRTLSQQLVYDVYVRERTGEKRSERAATVGAAVRVAIIYSRLSGPRAAVCGCGSPRAGRPIHTYMHVHLHAQTDTLGGKCIEGTLHNPMGGESLCNRSKPFAKIVASLTAL